MLVLSHTNFETPDYNSIAKEAGIPTSRPGTDADVVNNSDCLAHMT